MEAVIRLSLMGVDQDIRLDLRNIGNEPLLKGTGLDTLSLKRLYAFLEYADHKFRVDARNPLPWKEQFLGAFVAMWRALGTKACCVTAVELAALRKGVFVTNQALALQGGAEGVKEFRETLSYQYHDGFDHMTRDDDFFAVRCGNRIVEIIPLPGNDYNELKSFIRNASRRILERENIERFRAACCEMRKSRAAKLANREVKKQRKGLSVADYAQYKKD